MNINLFIGSVNVNVNDAPRPAPRIVPPPHQQYESHRRVGDRPRIIVPRHAI